MREKKVEYVTVKVQDPYHGDPNGRYPMLGAWVTRRVPREQLKAAAHSRPAIY